MPRLWVLGLVLLRLGAADQPPADPAGERAAIQQLLTAGRPEEALSRARELSRRIPDDLAAYGLIVDAARATKRFAEAERAAQWMLDLRPWEVAALYRAAQLRADFGDRAGAVDLFNDCYHRTQEPRERARILLELARLFVADNKKDEARGLATEAARLQGKH
jgi:predicted Zn-dependent protease